MTSSGWLMLVLLALSFPLILSLAYTDTNILFADFKLFSNL